MRRAPARYLRVGHLANSAGALDAQVESNCVAVDVSKAGSQ
jgi:hypothetical protein